MKLWLAERCISKTAIPLLAVLAMALAAERPLPAGVPLSSAGSRVSGTTVTADGSFLAGVRVSLSGNGVNQKTVTGTDGVFEFVSVPAGDYSVVFQAKGMKKITREITVSSVDLDMGHIVMGE